MANYKVYKVTFTQSQHCYIGITKQALSRRISQHRTTKNSKKISNYYLTKWLSQHRAHRVEVVSNHRSKSDALRAEQLELKRLVDDGYLESDLLLNRTLSKIALPSQHRTANCSICHRLKPRYKFSIDKTRFNGLNSRCKQCYNHISTLVRRGVFEWSKARHYITKRLDKFSND